MVEEFVAKNNGKKNTKECTGKLSQRSSSTTNANGSTLVKEEDIGDVTYDTNELVWEEASSVDPLHLKYFSFSGRVIALALMHKVQVGIVFDHVFFLQLSERSVTSISEQVAHFAKGRHRQGSGAAAGETVKGATMAVGDLRRSVKRRGTEKRQPQGRRRSICSLLLRLLLSLLGEIDVLPPIGLGLCLHHFLLNLIEGSGDGGVAYDLGALD
ncbi:hypothetical protein Cni_G14481 [Canna indica]|uniref:Uncharacterized protein n=1 Tax=Canna indica TaxID=4628 RepID=A0AAQ3KEA9_9LILI|nr:hypothetical protein Cni_G14481 [Canna indica]